MTQRALLLHDGELLEKVFPAPEALVSDCLPWGRFDVFFTPAYWANACWMHSVDYPTTSLRLGKSLMEEAAACLLGGHGIPAEIGLAAFRRLAESNLLEEEEVGAERFQVHLSTPLEVGGHPVRYRFARQKAQYLADLHRRFRLGGVPTEALPLRQWMMDVKGVGPKTASWIVRNWLYSDEVAILDIHILRAGRLAGFFPVEETVERHYFSLEKRFLSFSKGIGARASELDAVIWSTMREMPEMVDEALAHICEKRSTAGITQPSAHPRNTLPPQTGL
jgi:thermostable 8-oxoguanine DNA glycosylase